MEIGFLADALRFAGRVGEVDSRRSRGRAGVKDNIVAVNVLTLGKTRKLLGRACGDYNKREEIKFLYNLYLENLNVRLFQLA